MPMLHVLTYRPEFSPPWPPRSTSPPRAQPPGAPAGRGADHAAGEGKTLPAEVVQHIIAKTDGVPLYVEELTTMLLASALLREEESKCAHRAAAHGGDPDTLQDALMARLDQLNTAKEVAQLAAVLGREFAYELLQAIAPQDEPPCTRDWRSWWGPNSSTSRGGRRGPGIYLSTPDPGRPAYRALKSTRQSTEEIAQVLKPGSPRSWRPSRNWSPSTTPRRAAPSKR